MEKTAEDEYMCARCKEKHNFQLPTSDNPRLNRVCWDCTEKDKAELESKLYVSLTEEQRELYEKISELRSHITSYVILMS